MSHPKEQSEVVYPLFKSTALECNPLNDPSERKVPVYLPPGYHAEANAEQRYPVVYLLAGYAGTGPQMMNFSAWEETMPQRMDRLIAEGKTQPMILVMPDCFTRYGGSQYLNSSAIGNYEDYLLEITQFVDQNFRTKADRDHRAVAGKSSGGYGATMMGMKHPDTFGLVADHCGDKYFELCYKPDFGKFLRATGRFKNLHKVLKDPFAVHPKDGTFFSLINVAAMAACYSPNPESEWGFDLPFELHTGEMKPEVWQRWLEVDPVEIIDQHADALKSLKLLYLDCGNRDEYNLQFGGRLFSERLKARNITHHYEEFDGGHRSTSFRYDVSIPAISDAIGTD